MFVSEHGGQSEIVLRVKQGDNPAFGFLMPNHHLHAYFRFLVDHQELLKPDSGGKSLVEKDNAESGLNQTGGALSILGSVYGSAEDEDGATEDVHESKRNESEEAIGVGNATVSHGSEQAESPVNVTGKGEVVAKGSDSILKEKASVIKRNRFISTVGTISGIKKEGDALSALSTAGDKSQASLLSMSKVEPPIVEPSSDLKRVVDKIVEFILRNGKDFEAVLVEQDKKHGRFPFLLPSNRYHPYYLKVLKDAQESKLPGKGSVSEKHDSMGHGVDKKTALSKEGDTLSGESAGHDIPYNYDRKEKFKMKLGKSKKDGQDPPSKATEPQIDAVSAAAILQAATRGIKNPSFEFFPKTSSNGIGHGPSTEDGHTSSFGSLHSSQAPSSASKLDPSVSVPVAKAIAETAAIAAASEADSSEACLTREQQLKAERLKRAKMFAAMIKGGAAPVKIEPSRGFSAEPLGSGISGSGAEVENFVGKEREGSSVPMDVDSPNKNEKSEKKISVDEYNERRSKRSYRSRSKRQQEEEEVEKGGGGEEEEEEEEEEEDKRSHKHSRKKHRLHRSSHRSRDRHKHRKRHSPSEVSDSRHHQKYYDDSFDDEHRHSRRRQKHNTPSDDEYRHSRHRHRHDSSSDDEHRHSQRQHKHHSSDNGLEHRSRSAKNGKSQSEKEVDLEEGEILTRSDQSKASQGDGASREASVELSKSYQDGRAPSQQPSETTEVSDDLRAKIRAMLMATL
ncbi:hypothetical protein FH972_020308 [Carpinus fangiana]|uniref:SURP motif domain-containing protein n=1 Tax=Carpinus fangiana TaxID=176857 RepID=A0A5N6RW06_9ROSI|nr:hypothetical protein FH972_020308 [Carpinus fangiana]KAE8125510.1 hypothetical protein FH972_020308 [Carpinus fangiana]KAE8125511.1 hypothetical protein FH972_020308 [Carpinus fangiana]KAE8125512.1 hypothetical protein FH972_020308 [Carpinus fangiana]